MHTRFGGGSSQIRASALAVCEGNSADRGSGPQLFLACMFSYLPKPSFASQQFHFLSFQIEINWSPYVFHKIHIFMVEVVPDPVGDNPGYDSNLLSVSEALVVVPSDKNTFPGFLPWSSKNNTSCASFYLIWSSRIVFDEKMHMSRMCSQMFFDRSVDLEFEIYMKQWLASQRLSSTLLVKSWRYSTKTSPTTLHNLSDSLCSTFQTR